MSFDITAKAVKGPSSFGSIDLAVPDVVIVYDGPRWCLDGIWVEDFEEILKNLLEFVTGVISHHNLDDYMRRRWVSSQSRTKKVVRGRLGSQPQVLKSAQSREVTTMSGIRDISNDMPYRP
ncbi:hypothetical protein D8674_026888 [Pyrus ussuriensis x Pyrus communis]|uniref:Uncharacterized protein n=1 Tax=Pyrus ussuriensis x Pyrus communis TaxID=2448454 RepID=A0A5N5IMX7_9ROSA|nr:hypothetical protein D8674_026888 [Pyrus ussuriensis x Pyrus communis]